MSIIYIDSYRFTAPAGGLWTPAEITSALWLDANDASTVTQSGGAITSWLDKSGSSHTAIATGNPTYNATGMSTGKPAVQLDGQGDFFTSAISGFGGFSSLDFFIVAQTTVAAASNTDSAIFWGYGNIGGASGIYPADTSLCLASSAGILSGERIAIIAEYAGFNEGRLGSSTYSRPANTIQLLNTRMSSQGTSLIVNGSTVALDLGHQINGSLSIAPSAIGYTVDNNLHLGALRAVGNLIATSALKFAEIVVTNSILSTLDRQKLEGYLAHKWGMAANLPAAHPYKSIPPTV